MHSSAATAAAEPPDEPPGMRVMSHGLRVTPKRGILRGAAHGKLVHVQPAKNNRPGRFQFLDDRRVVGRDEFAENLRAAVQRLAFARR